MLNPGMPYAHSKHIHYTVTWVNPSGIVQWTNIRFGTCIENLYFGKWYIENTEFEASPKVFNTQYMTNSTLVCPVEYVTKNNIFGLKMMMKSGLEKNILKFHRGLQRYLLTCQANSAFLGRFFCTGQQQL